MATSGLDTPPVARAGRHAASPHPRPDPQAGVDGPRSSATALAPTAVEAEALAKAALLSGPAMAGRWLRRHGGLVVRDDGDVQTTTAPLARQARFTVTELACMTNGPDVQGPRVLAAQPLRRRRRARARRRLGGSSA